MQLPDNGAFVDPGSDGVMSMHTTDTRDARLATLPWLGPVRLAELRRKTVAVLGVGNIGGQAAQHFVMVGTKVVLVDRDVVETVNLGTQAFTEDDIGLPKAEARARWLGPLNPRCRIEPIHADIRRLGLGALRECDLLVSCLDSRTGRAAVNGVATRLGIPWIDGALDGAGRAVFARVAAYDPRGSDGGCYMCPHDAASVLKVFEAEAGGPGCSSRWWGMRKEVSPPTVAVSALGGAIASIQAIWGLRFLLGAAHGVGGTEVYLDLDRNAFSVHQLKRNPRCLFDHRVYDLIRLGSDVHQATIEYTFAMAEKSLGEGVTLRLLNRTIVTRLVCFRCGAEAKPCRLLETLDADDAVCHCGGELAPSPSGLLEKFDRTQSAEFLSRTWAQTGMPDADVVVASNGSRELPFLIA